jgi:hypothetical protein
MSPPCASRSSYKDNDIWSHAAVDDGKSRAPASQHQNDDSHIHGGRKGKSGNKIWAREENNIINGIWPGVLDSSFLTRFIA